MSTNSIALLALLALLVFWAVGAYNRLVRLKNVIADVFGAVDHQFKDRHDLILKLVEAAGEYMQHDRVTLDDLMQARSTVSTAHDAARSSPSSARLLLALLAAEQQLQAQFSAFWEAATSTLAVLGDPKVRELGQQLATTQSKLAFACQAFNLSVTNFNAAQRQFPTLLVARLFGFAPAVGLRMGEGSA